MHTERMEAFLPQSKQRTSKGPHLACLYRYGLDSLYTIRSRIALYEKSNSYTEGESVVS